MTSYPTWPANPFPQSPQFANYGETPLPSIIRTSMDVGNPKVRQRSSLCPIQYICKFVFSDAQLDTFDAFLKQSCNGGATPFTWVDPKNGNPGTFRFVQIGTTAGGSSTTGAYQPYAPGYWSVTFIMEAVLDA